MSRQTDIQQLEKYAEDLQKIFKSDKEKNVILKNAAMQMKKYAEDLNHTIGELKKANRKLRNQIELEEREKQMQRKMIHFNKMTSLGTLASGIAHEINNPISYILGNSQILQELWEEIEKVLDKSFPNQSAIALKGIPFAEIKDLVPKILRNNVEGARQISLITAKLKDFSRQENQQSTGETDINQAIEYAIAILDKEIKKYTDDFRVKLDKKIPSVTGSIHEMEQVLINIIQNALQSLPEKSRGIKISTTLKKKNHSIVIRIKDNGRGMTREILNRVKEPFFTTRENCGGTGLGLYISYSIIKKAGGDLEISSIPNEGTEVVISLPASAPGACRG